MSVFTKRTSKRQRASTDQATSLHSLAKSTLLGCFIAAIIGLLLLLLVSVIVLQTGDPGRYVGMAGTLLLYITVLLGGMIATRLHHRRAPLLCGLLTGGVFLLVMLLSSLFMENGTNTDSIALRIGLHALLFPVCVMGALLGSKEKSKKPHRKHRK